MIGIEQIIGALIVGFILGALTPESFWVWVEYKLCNLFDSRWKK